MSTVLTSHECRNNHVRYTLEYQAWVLLYSCIGKIPQLPNITDIKTHYHHLCCGLPSVTMCHWFEFSVDPCNIELLTALSKNGVSSVTCVRGYFLQIRSFCDLLFWICVLEWDGQTAAGHRSWGTGYRSSKYGAGNSWTLMLVSPIFACLVHFCCCMYYCGTII